MPSLFQSEKGILTGGALSLLHSFVAHIMKVKVQDGVMLFFELAFGVEDCTVGSIDR